MISLRMLLPVCVLFLGAIQPRVLEACGCGYLDALSKCPGCEYQIGSTSCDCVGGGGLCTDQYGNPYVPSVTCRYERWSWTQNDNGPLICALEVLCERDKMCRPEDPGDCSGNNPCSTSYDEFDRWKYYIKSPLCSIPPDPDPQ